jgi:hypothetical protein
VLALSARRLLKATVFASTSLNREDAAVLRSPALPIVALGAVVGLAGDAAHVASGTTEYLWDGVPVIWRSAIWFPLALAASVVGLAHLGRGSSLRATRARTPADALAGAAAVLALYALTAALRGEPDTVSVVLVSALAIVVWAWWDPSPGAALGGAIAAVLGPAAEIAVVQLGAARYASDADGLFGVAPWLPPLYFAAGAVAFRLWEVFGRTADAATRVEA